MTYQGNPRPVIKGHKWCWKAQHYVRVEGFTKNRSVNDGLQTMCRDCRKIVSRIRGPEYRRQLHEDTIHYLGSTCRCCGESNSLFLTVDHINNDGNLDRPYSPSTKRRQNISAALCARRSNWDTKRFQVLCYNCNCGKERNKGVCPHEEK